MKKIATFLITMLLSINIVNAEEKKTLADAIGTDCIDKHKISPAAFGCGIKKLFKKKDGTPNIKDSQLSGNACEHWSRYKEDIQLIKKLGVKYYRFSLEWSKIEPKQGEYSQSALDHYSNVFPILKDKEIPGVFLVNTSSIEGGIVLDVHKNHLLRAKLGFDNYKYSKHEDDYKPDTLDMIDYYLEMEKRLIGMRR